MFARSKKRNRIVPEDTARTSQTELLQESPSAADAEAEENVQSTSLTDIRDAYKVKRNEAAIDERPWYIVHPESSFAGAWDMVTGIALIFTALVTPFEVAFLESPTSVDALWVINRIIDLVFVFDMMISFNMMYKLATTAGISAESKWEVRPRKIVLHYLRGWFSLDLISVFPSIFDILPIISGGTGSYGPVKVLRVVKVLKLIKLVRLVRGSRIIQRWQTRVAISYANLTLAGVFFQVIFVTHLFACVLALQTMSANKLETWMATFGYCRPNGYDENGDQIAECVNAFKLYINCLYWALGVIAGFATSPDNGPYEPYFDGDYESFTDGELLVNLLINGLGAIGWAYVTAKFVDVISNADPDATAFRQTMDNLNRFCKFNKLPPDMARQLREYYYETKQIQAAEARAEICAGMSPDLQQRVAMKLNEQWLKTVPFFKGLRMLGDHPGEYIQLVKPVESDFLAQVALKLTAAVYTPNEKPPRGRLYVVYGGAATYKGRTITLGQSWGEIDVMLPKAPRQYRALALTYLHVLYIDGETLNEISHKYPKSRKSLKTWSMYNGLKEFLLHNLQEERKAMHRTPAQDEGKAEAKAEQTSVEGASPQLTGPLPAISNDVLREAVSELAREFESMALKRLQGLAAGMPLAAPASLDETVKPRQPSQEM